MFQITAERTFPIECENYTGQRRILREGSLSLTVPSMLEDEKIRWQLERGVPLVDAYQRAGAYYIYPDVSLRRCVEEVFKTPYFDPDTGEWKTGAGQYTCVEFQKCLQQYASGQAAFPEESLSDRRVSVAPGVYAPSPQEERCIKGKLLELIPLEVAYDECGAGDILPGWSGALAFVQSAYMNAIAENKPFPSLYNLTKRAYQIYAIQPQEAPATPPHIPAIPPPITPPPEKKTPWALYLVIGGVAVLMSR